jgi:serine/threonine protein kinase
MPYPILSLAPNGETRKQVLQWCMELSRALCFLHNCNPVIIHRDLKVSSSTTRTKKDAKQLGDTCHMRTGNEAWPVLL